MQWLSQIIEILTGGLTGIAAGMGKGIAAGVAAIMQGVDNAGAPTNELSIFGIFIIVFAAISLGLGLFRWVLNFFTSLGSRNS